MRIVIDMQGAQTESRFRGIGRYTLSLARAIVRNRGEHEIILALNGLFPDTIEPIRATFDDLLPQENIRVWYAPGPVRECEPGNAWRREIAERIREAFLASLQPDVVHVSSLFEGHLDDAVTSIGVFARGIPMVVTLYDLIPLLNPETYLKPNSTYEKYYLRKIEYLKKANAWLAISEVTANEGRKTLGLELESVTNISAACDPIFKRMEISSHDREQLLRKFRITKPFVMYSGGADSRKNLHRLIQAYANLPRLLRSQHQLVIVGKISEGDAHVLKAAARSVRISDEDMVFTGYVTDKQLAKLYNLCKLFVFPSWHEGFGLPVLEAMSCGAAVIGANTSSLPEVIRREDALFDPFSEEVITEKIAEVLGSEAFRQDLSRHGLKQSKLFSWDESGRRAIRAFEQASKYGRPIECGFIHPLKKPKLAYISPLPPERTGIADYSAELLPALSYHYDIEVVVAQTKGSDPWIRANCPIHDPQWLRDNADRMDRVLYQLGNSPFHQYMLDLLAEIPGTVVLHDFFLSNLPFCLEESGSVPNAWTQALYHCHGYATVREHYQGLHVGDMKLKYPVNLEILQHAQGIIVHSEYSRTLAKEWLGENFSDEWRVIPLLRTPYVASDRSHARSILGLQPDNFVLCSFGFLDPTKYNHRLLQAFLQSRLAQDSRCLLVFVGENHAGEYGRQLREAIRSSGLAERIRITGWADHILFRNYLVVADLAVQLRTLSRGETSAAMLDCLNHAIPTITNANGSFAELPLDTVWMLDDEFDDVDLVAALETLWRDQGKRKALANCARELILTRHSPETCAQQYAQAIEGFYHVTETDRHHLVRAIAVQDNPPVDENAWQELASCIAQNQPDRRLARNLFVDVTATSRTDLKTGIERVARALLLELVNTPPLGYRIEPVYLTDRGGQWRYCYARRYTLELLECPSNWLDDEPVEVQPGDVLFVADFAGHVVVEAEKAAFYHKLKQIGVSIYFTVFDLLPVKMPEVFPPRANEGFEAWLRSVCQIADGVVCISRSVADDLHCWLEENPLRRMRPVRICWMHLGANLDASVPSKEMPVEGQSVLDELGLCYTFLMVGTIEPRKGYLQVIAAFDQLWRQGMNVNLVIVGKEGWKDLPEEMRRTIPKIVNALRHHSKCGKRLFWLEGISDAYLEKIYATSTCLIAASEGEGFGLPLIEAAQHKVPIIARDIPVFREVAGEYAYYFNGLDASDLAGTIKEWITLYERKQHPKSENMPWLMWEQSTEKLKKILFNSNWQIE